MKEDKLYRSLEYVRDEYLDSAADAMQQGRAINRFRKTRAWLIAAACLVIISVIVTMPFLHLANDPLIGVDEIELSASDIAELFDIQFLDAGGTKRYTQVTIDNPNDFLLSDEKYLPIYEYNPTGIPINQEEYEEFVNSRKMRLLKAMDKVEPPFWNRDPSVDTDSIIEITHLSYPDSEKEYRGYIGTIQRLYTNEIHYTQAQYYEQVYLDGELLAIHQGQSDQEIIASLESIKQKLFAIFDDAFTDVKIVRY